MTVTIPEGVVAGSEFNVDLEGGYSFPVLVPSGFYPGDALMVDVPVAGDLIDPRSTTAKGNLDQLSAVDSVSSMQEFGNSLGRADPSRKWSLNMMQPKAGGVGAAALRGPGAARRGAAAATVRGAGPFGARGGMMPGGMAAGGMVPGGMVPGGMAAAAARLQSTWPTGPTEERLAVLEAALLGGETMMGSATLERLEWLDSQLGLTVGTVLERLDMLEDAAREQMLLW